MLSHPYIACLTVRTCLCPANAETKEVIQISWGGGEALEKNMAVVPKVHLVQALSCGCCRLRILYSAITGHSGIVSWDLACRVT